MFASRAAVLVAALPLLGLAAACGGAATPAAPPDTGPSLTSSPTPVVMPCAYPPDGRTPSKPATLPPATPATTKPTPITITTNDGAIPITLEGDKAPCTVNSFLSLARQGYFNNTPCHRLVTAGIYVLQCGDPTGTGSGTPGYTFKDELIANDPRIAPCRTATTPNGGQRVCNYPAGTVAMANSGPATNGSQFFLVYADSPLPNAYTVFGQMDAQGLQTVKAIAAKGVDASTGATSDGPPKQKVTIISVK